MRRLLASTALVAALSFSPALAQQASSPLAEPPIATVSPPADASAANAAAEVTAESSTEALTDDSKPIVQGVAPAEAEVKPDTDIATAEESSKAVNQLASVDVELPAEVQAVAMNDRYTTADLVAAQLAAISNGAAIEPAPEAVDGGSPVFNRAGDPGAWSQSASPGQPAPAPDSATPPAGDSL